MVYAVDIHVQKKDARMSCRILVSTTVGWTSTARHAAGFALAGCEIEAVAPAHAPVTLSRHVSRTHLYRALSPLRSLRQAIRQAQPDLIVSCDDRAVQHLVRLYQCEPRGSALADAIERSLGAPEEYACILSRQASMQAARELGIRTPETLPVPDENALEDCLNALGLPAVLKTDGSWGGEGVAIVQTRAAARSAYRRLSRAPSLIRNVARAFRRKDGHYLVAAVAPERHKVTLQKFVPGSPAASGFAAWNGEIVGAIYYDVLKADGAIGPPSVIRRVDCPEIAEATRKIARHFRLSGLHGLDFIRDETGQVHLLEINPRATQGGTLPFGPDRDLAFGLASCIMPGAKSRAAIPNDTVVFFPREWLCDPDSASLREGFHDVPWDDPTILRACLQAAEMPPAPAGKSARLNLSATIQLSMPIAART
jgi:glutathione synthase/RimK-type ligase-like ATP-grasp enzyme